MLKKRLIFALLWDSGQFCLSRNFRLQRLGDLRWLTEQYRFTDIASSIDELLVLDVTRGSRLSDEFLSTLSALAATMHMPIGAGGGVRDTSNVRDLLGAGADKVVCNSLLVNDKGMLEAIRERFGQQSITASVDVLRTDQGYQVMIENGTQPYGPLVPFLDRHVLMHAGELLLNSIDRDGTGQGLDFDILASLPGVLEQPIILMGGTGTTDHVVEGLAQPLVDAVATSNLLNFIGDGLTLARAACVDADIPIPKRLSATEVCEEVE